MRARPSLSLVAALGLAARSLAAAPAPAPRVADSDHYSLSLRSETTLQLFRRALLPGHGGALVSSDTAAPLNQYLTLRVLGLDAGTATDSIDLELAVWGRLWLGERGYEEPFDGDVQAANVHYRHSWLALRVGRQIFAGGAARYARFDGLSAGAELGAGLTLLGYGGFTVLPRWNARRNYKYLGVLPAGELRSSELVEGTERTSNWLGGARLTWASRQAQVAASFHEERRNAASSRRSVGLDTRADVIERATLGANAVFEVDPRRFSDIRVWADVRPHADWDLTAELLHTEPALFLSRQSVLSVFSTEGYDELGGLATVRVSRPITLHAGGWLQRYAEDELGSRSELTARFVVDEAHDTLLRLTYGRVIAPDNGYHLMRSSLARRLFSELSGTLDLYAYFYDEAIRGYSTSTVYSGTLSYVFNSSLTALWGASVSRSAYASFDAQTLVQARYDFDLAGAAGAAR